MRQEQFDRLLAWTMLSAHNSAVIEQQNILQRDLTQDEYKECYKNTQKKAELIRQELVKGHGKSDK